MGKLNGWILPLAQTAQSVLKNRPAQNCGWYVVVLTWDAFTKQRLSLRHIVTRYVCQDCFL